MHEHNPTYTTNQHVDRQWYKIKNEFKNLQFNTAINNAKNNSVSHLPDLLSQTNCYYCHLPKQLTQTATKKHDQLMIQKGTFLNVVVACILIIIVIYFKFYQDTYNDTSVTV